MRTAAMKVGSYISTAVIAKIYIGGLWKFARTEFLVWKLYWVEIQRFHREPPHELIIVSNFWRFTVELRSHHQFFSR